MKTDKIKVSELKNYIDTGLSCKYYYNNGITDQNYDTIKLEECKFPEISLKVYWKVKPIVRPFESMTDEEAIHIAKIVGDIHNDSMDDKFKVSIKGYIVVDTPWFGRIQLFYKGRNIHFRVYSTEWNNLELKEALNVQKALEYLYSKGFDVFNWIDRGLAIEKKND